MPKIVTKTEGSDAHIVSLDDAQLGQLMAAAEHVPIDQRSSFLKSVANMINTVCNPSDYDVAEAITLVLSARGISYRPPAPRRARIFFNDAKPRRPNSQSHGFLRRRNANR